jgi:hypothetical protein
VGYTKRQSRHEQQFAMDTVKGKATTVQIVLAEAAYGCNLVQALQKTSVRRLPICDSGNSAERALAPFQKPFRTSENASLIQ